MNYEDFQEHYTVAEQKQLKKEWEESDVYNSDLFNPDGTLRVEVEIAERGHVVSDWFEEGLNKIFEQSEEVRDEIATDHARDNTF